MTVRLQAVKPSRSPRGTSGGYFGTQDTGAAGADRIGPGLVVQSVFYGKWDAAVWWWTPPTGLRETYEVAFRTRNSRDTAWLNWTTLPGRTTATRLDVGDDLKLVRERLYQYRVRVFRGQDEVSPWVTSPVRFAGELEAPSGFIYPISQDRPYDEPDVYGALIRLPGKAWRYNVDFRSMKASLDARRPAEEMWSNVVGGPDRYVMFFRGPVTVRPCWVGVTMRFPGESKWQERTAEVTCPK